jgi:FkbM family methyltransferase
LRLSFDYLNKGKEFLRDNQLAFSLQEKTELIRAGLLRDEDLKTRVIKKRLRQDNYGSYFDLAAYKLYFDIDSDISNHLEMDPALSDYDSIVGVICRVIFESFILRDFLDKSAQPTNGNIVLDIGAYIGSTALLVSELIGDTGVAYAFEPITWNSLSFNMRVNNCLNVEVIAKGISDSDEKAPIHVVHGGVGNMCTVNVRDYTRAKKVQNTAAMNDFLKHSTIRMIELTTIDNFCQRKNLERIDYIKLDVEGMEERAIRGAERTIQECHPKWSIDSNHMDSRGEPQHPKLVQLLESFEYTLKERTQNAHIWAY